MPEIVEVKRYGDLIRKKMLNQNITQINILNGRYKKHGPPKYFNKLIPPIKIIDVNTKGKLIYITFDNGYILLNTLGLSGGWTFKEKNKFIFPNSIEFLNAKSIEQYKDNSLNHLNVEFKTKNGILYFYDTLSYGTISITNLDGLQKKLNSLGPDIMETNLNTFTNRIKLKKHKKIGLVLMNQKIISGIGNYLRADSLWLAKISPHRLVNDLTDSDIKHIFNAILELTWGDYNQKKGIKKGIIKGIKLPYYYKRDFFVYYENKDIYGNDIKKEELYEGSQKRSIYWVPKIQK